MCYKFKATAVNDIAVMLLTYTLGFPSNYLTFYCLREFQNNRLLLLDIFFVFFSYCLHLALQEVCVSRGGVLELLYCDSKTGKISVLCSQEIFGVIRSLLAFRLTGGAKGGILELF
jgi:hypothetical protein